MAQDKRKAMGYVYQAIRRNPEKGLKQYMDPRKTDVGMKSQRNVDSQENAILGTIDYIL